ncbi:MAG: TIGR02757 family protein [Bacteroidota bacterium]
MSPTELFEILELKHRQYNQPSFIDDDPISIPHQFTRKEDIEISGFLSATIAWGQRKTIINNARKLVEMMDMSPYEFVMNATEGELEPVTHFVHRTLNGQDCLHLILGLRAVYQTHGGLETVFSKGIQPQDEDVMGGIMSARTAITSREDFPQRTHKHVANPSRGSSAKRINMFLRWMVRKDLQGVDFGIWDTIGMHQLIVPLDVHTGNVARKLGLLERKQNDWKAAKALTDCLKEFAPDDPVKYDFSLFGLGVYDDL